MLQVSKEPKIKEAAADSHDVMTDCVCRPSYFDTITIVAGAGEAHFTVHKDLICKMSGFFTAACSSAWAEGKNGVVRLPTVEADTAKLYIHWVYAHDVDVPRNDFRQLISIRRATQQHKRFL